ncbi:MAG: hypothetical protein HFJ28_05460 [Clostridia bacterium]|nr:hypothetical protein [Clostridia bacterium]
MLQDFRTKDTVDEIIQAKTLEQEYNKIVEQLQKIHTSIYAKKATMANLKQEQSMALVIKKKSSILSRIASLFRRGKYHQINEQMKQKEKKLKEIEEECKDLESRAEDLEASKQELSAKKEKTEVPGCMQEQDGMLIITDRTVDLPNKEPKEDKVLVHCTNFFPQNHTILSDYDGGKIGSTIAEYRGVRKEVKALIPRHEVHFTINNRVENTGAGEGNWDNPSYIIIDRCELHEAEMESTNPSDSWTKGTSMQLSDDAIIMVRLEENLKLPITKEEMQKYNIVFYEGDATKCLRNFLRLNQYEILKTDANYAGHFHSSRIVQEKGVVARNIATNFMQDNTYFLKDPPVFTQEEIGQIADIGMNYQADILSPAQEALATTQIGEDKKRQYSALMNFVIGSGMKKLPDGRYTFKDDTQILEDIEFIQSNPEILPDNIDKALIDEVFAMQQQVRKQYEEAGHPELNQVANLPLQELYQFKHQVECEAVQSSLPSNMEMVSTEKGVIVAIYEEDFEEVAKNIKPEDGIKHTSLGSNGILETTISKSTLTADIEKVIENITQKIEGIKKRVVKEETR